MSWFRRPLIAASLFLALSPAGAFAQAGELDPAFGGGDGKVTTDLTSRGDFAGAIAIQADGKIVIAGGAAWDASNPRFALVRYNIDGTLDTSFGGDGKVTTDFTRGLDAAWGVAIQPDGKIVAAGDAALDSRDSRFAIARYNTDGTKDDSFGGDGKVTTQFTRFDDAAAGLAIQADGKIVVSGGAAYDDRRNPKFALARYNTDGTLDTSFAGDGRVTTDFRAGNDFANAVIPQADGKLVAAGLASFSRTQGRARLALARYNTDGTLDTSFAGDGRVTTDYTRWNDSVQNLAIQPDGQIVAGGIAGSGGSNANFALARYNTDGTLDGTLSGDGRVTTDLSFTYDAARDVALQPDGKIVLGGEAAGSREFAIARYNNDGTLDSTFSDDGRAMTNFTPGFDFAFGLGLQADGGLVLAGGSGWGGSNPNVALARYLGS